MKKLLINFLQFLLFLGIGVTLLFLVFRHQNNAYLDECCIKNIPEWETVQQETVRKTLLEECRQKNLRIETCPSLATKLLADFKSTRFGWIALVLLCFVISNISRTFKWLMLLQPMGYRPRFINGFLSILVGYFANLGLPRMGEVVRGGLLSRYENIPVEKVMGTIVVDRAVDVICLGIAFLLALLFESEKILGYIAGNRTEDGAAGGSGSYWLIALLTGLVFAMLLFVFRARVMKNPIVKKVITLFKGFMEGIQTVRKLERPWLFVFHSLNIWFLFFLMTWLGFQAFGPTEHLGFRAALTVFVFGTLGFVIPSPGGMGTFHALVIACLTLFYNVRGDDAFSMANIIFFSVQIGFNSVLGLIALLLLPWINRRAAAV